MIVVPGMAEKKIHIMPIGGKNKPGGSALQLPLRAVGGHFPRWRPFSIYGLKYTWGCA